MTSMRGTLYRLRAAFTTRRVLFGGPATLITLGIVQGVIIRTEWLTKPLMKAPNQISGEVSSEGKYSENAERKVTKNSNTTQLARIVKTLDDIIAQAKEGSLLETLKGKGLEILKDFEHLSKREKGDIIDILKGKARKTAKETSDQLIDKQRAIVEKVRKTVIDFRSRIRVKGDKMQTGSLSSLEKIAKIMKMTREAEEEYNSQLMLEIGSVLDAAASSKRRKIKLLFIGDSLSACVGVDKTSDGPVLQETVANSVQKMTGCDVEWYNSAVIGGTVREIRDKLSDAPFLKSIRRDEHLVVVLICGLNDYKSFLFSLWNPMLAIKSGPMSFKAEIVSLLNDIREECVSDNSSVFLPAIPVKFMASDPKFLFSVFPLNFMGLSLNNVWEIQKYNIAFEQQEDQHLQGVGMTNKWSSKNTFYIAEPEPESTCESKSLNGDVSSITEADVIARDGVHLNSNGYKLWGRHLAAEISLHLVGHDRPGRPDRYATSDATGTTDTSVSDVPKDQSG